MRVLTSKDGDLVSYFKTIDGTEAGIGGSSLRQILINKHEVYANKGKKSQLSLQHFFGFCKTFMRVINQLGFHLASKIRDLHDIIYATLANDTTVTIDKLYLYIPIFFADDWTQILFNDSIGNSFTIPFDSWFNDKKVIHTEVECQVDLRSAHSVNTPKFSIVAHQTAAWIGVPNEANNIAAFDILNVRKFFAKIDSVRRSKYSVSINYAENDYTNQYRGLKK